MSEFAAYVWAAYGVSAVGLVAMAVLSLRAWWTAKRAVKDLPTKF